MQANVVVNLMPYVTEPSPDNLTSLLRSVTSCRKLQTGETSSVKQYAKTEFAIKENGNSKHDKMVWYE